jgi:hypothetical protein
MLAWRVPTHKAFGVFSPPSLFPFAFFLSIIPEGTCSQQVCVCACVVRRRLVRIVCACVFRNVVHTKTKWHAEAHCIRKPWLEWIAALVERRFYPAQQDTTATVVIAYSDASPKGWGGVFFVFGKTFIIGAPWSRRVAEGQHINVMELMAARNTLRHISAMLHGVVTFVVDLYVDNTTAKSWLSKQRSRTHVANDILLELSSNDGFRCLRSVSWISSSENVADYASRNFEE